MFEQRKVVLHGLRNEKSVAAGVVEALLRDGFVVCLGVQNEEIVEQIRPLVDAWGRSPRVEGRGWISFVDVCDVTKDESLDGFYGRVALTMSPIDGVIHSIAGGNRRSVNVPLMKVRRQDYLNTIDVSAFSVVSIAQRAAPLMKPGGRIIGFTYRPGSEFTPDYEAMGSAKAAFENIMRTLAYDLGFENDLRVFTLDLAPIDTDAAGAVKNFAEFRKAYALASPLGETTNLDVGNMVSLLFDDRFGAETGATIPVTRGGHLLPAIPIEVPNVRKSEVSV